MIEMSQLSEGCYVMGLETLDTLLCDLDILSIPFFFKIVSG